MQVQELTQNGIQKFFKGESVILQIFNTVVQTHEKHNQKVQMIRATISDGFAYFQSIYLFVDGFSNKTIQLNVVRVKLMDNIVKKLAKGNQPGKKPLLTDSNNFAVIGNKITRKIGNPISFQQFIRNGKKNPKGSRSIQNSKEEDQDTQDDLFQEAQKLRQKLKNKKQPNQNTNSKIQRQRQRQSQSNAHTNTNSNTRNNSLTNQPKLNQKPKPKANQSLKPIQKVEKTQNSRNQPIKRLSIKPQIKHHEGNHEKIKQLFLGMENFKIYARLLFIWPIKVFTNKKGNQSQLLNLQFGDETATIMCTVFGDNAGRFQKLQLDKVFSISGATVTEATYKGVTELKLTFNESTQVGFQQNSTHIIKNIPTIQKFCISLRQLNQTQKGRVVTVLCMVKQCELVEFVSKNGNNVKKKILKLFDIQNQIQCQLTVFNQHAIKQYPMGMYALKGVQIDEFQGNKQFKTNIIFMARYLKNHQMNKRVNQVDQLTFVSINSNQKPKRQQISSFSQLNQKSLDLKTGQNLWTQTICYLKAVRFGGNSKNVYLSCPLCKKKIIQEDATHCNHCNKDIQRPKYRYILNINLVDDHDNIWVSAYDDAGQKVLALPTQQTFTADSYVEMSQQNFRQRINQLRYKQLKVKLVTTKQQFNNELRIKHKIAKILPIVFEEQNKNLLQKIKSLTGVM